MKRKKDDIIYLELIDAAITKIFEYINGVDEDLFLRNDMMKDACLTRLIVIGENGGKVSDELKEKFKDVEWQLMKAARNFFAHAYEYIDWRHVWDTINSVLPILKPKIENIIGILEREQNGKTN
jgi:uncharacterized protein with HEPN domain